MPLAATVSGILYRPLIFAQANILYNARKYDIKHEREIAFLVHDVSSRGDVDWEDFLVDPLDLDRLDKEPDDTVRFSGLEEPLTDKAILNDVKIDLRDWIYRDAPLMVKANEELDIYAGPSVNLETFQEKCDDAADERLQAEIDMLEEKYERKFDSLETKLTREERELEEDQADVQRRKQEEYTSYAETLFSFFAGRRRSLSTAMSKRGRRSKAQEDVDESIEEIADLKEEIADLKVELEQEIDDLEEKWMDVADDIEEVPIAPYKKDIEIEFFGVAWLPYYIVQVDDRFVEIPAFERGQ